MQNVPPSLSPKMARAWYVACLSSDLRQTPMARVVLGTPVVLFRGPDGAPAAEFRVTWSFKRRS